MNVHLGCIVMYESFSDTFISCIRHYWNFPKLTFRFLFFSLHYLPLSSKMVEKSGVRTSDKFVLNNNNPSRRRQNVKWTSTHDKRDKLFGTAVDMLWAKLVSYLNINECSLYGCVRVWVCMQYWWEMIFFFTSCGWTTTLTFIYSRYSLMWIERILTRGHQSAAKHVVTIFQKIQLS